MSVVARVRVNSVEINDWGSTVKMRPVVTTDDPHSEEIAAFFAATPAGSIELTIKNELAAEQFKVGTQYYLSFEPVSETETS